MKLHSIKKELAEIRVHLSPFGRKIMNDWAFTLSALIAYYLLISLLPLILCIFSATLLIFGNDQQFLNATRDRLVDSFPDQNIADVVNTLAKSISDQATAVFIISFFIAIFAGSRLFVGIDDVLTIIYHTRERPILTQNIYAIKKLLVFIIFLPIIIISSSITALLREDETFYYILSILFSGLFTFIFFNLIFHFVPNRNMSWKNGYEKKFIYNKIDFCFFFYF
jgi:uncharacterized BrkB/YihY/UPF0761 family membrane protein